MSVSTNLSVLFAAVAHVLNENQAAFNAADDVNGNHGDHMVAIFQAAAQAASEAPDASLAGAMEAASRELTRLENNGSAQVYAQGLEQFANQFRTQTISLEELLDYIQGLLGETQGGSGAKPAASPGVLKALVSGLAAWKEADIGGEPSPRGYDMGYLFDLGVIYFQAKGRNENKAATLADAAASASPLSLVSYRYQSGKLAIQTLLEAMRDAR